MLRLERTGTSHHSGSDGVASTNSTLTGGIKETEATKEDLARLKQVQAKLTQENSDHAQRAKTIEIKVEGHVSQDKLESSIASINDVIRQRKGLTEKRMSEMTTMIAQRDRQADERLKLMSKTMSTNAWWAS